MSLEFFVTSPADKQWIKISEVDYIRLRAIAKGSPDTLLEGTRLAARIVKTDLAAAEMTQIPLPPPSSWGFIVPDIQ